MRARVSRRDLDRYRDHSVVQSHADSIAIYIYTKREREREKIRRENIGRRSRLSIVSPEQRRLKAADGRGRSGVAQIWQHLLRNVLFEKLQRPSRGGVVAVDHCNNKTSVVFKCSEYIHKKERRKRRRRARHSVPPWQVSRVGNRSTSMITLPRLLFNGRCQVFLKISYCIAVEIACTRPGQRFHVSHENKIFDPIFCLFFSYLRSCVGFERGCFLTH